MTVSVAAGLWSASARAELYKYQKKDGTIVYTEDIGALPRERQVYYRAQEQKREERRRALEARLGSDALKEKEAEAEKKALAAAELDEAERRKRLEAIDLLLKQIRERRTREQADREAWQTRIREARETLRETLKKFEETQEEYNAIATQASFALLPGQAEKKAKLRKEVESLEKAVDALVVEVEETIPEEARKAGVPPGWLR